MMREVSLDTILRNFLRCPRAPCAEAFDLELREFFHPNCPMTGSSDR